MTDKSSQYVTTVYVDGLPGAGKSTLVQSIGLSIRLEDPEARIEVIDEYICPAMLDLMTTNIAKYGFSYQALMLQRRINILGRICNLLRNGVSVFVDRSLVGDSSFAKNLHIKGLMSDSEWFAYKEMMKEACALEETVKTLSSRVWYVYVDVSAEEAKKRIHRRSRSSEDSYNLEYLKGLETAHTTMYKELQVTPLYVKWPEQTPQPHQGVNIYDCRAVYEVLDIRV